MDLLSLINEPPMASSSSTDLVLDVSESEVKGDEGCYDTDEDIARGVLHYSTILINKEWKCIKFRCFIRHAWTWTFMNETLSVTRLNQSFLLLRLYESFVRDSM